jgi:aldose 1-epimerase
VKGDIVSNQTSRIEHAPYGEINEQPVERFVLSNDNGMSVAILSFGAIIQELHVPDARSTSANVVLGFDNLAQYGQKHPHFGAVIGRFANRIGGAQFALDGTIHELTPNKGTITAHGGAKGFDRYVWDAEVVELDHGPGVKLTHVSPDGDEGFPGDLTATVTYSLTGDNGLRMNYTATTTRPTVHNLTNHSYFNLGGEASGTIEDHVLTIHATHYTPTRPDQIPTGEIAPLAGTALDFSEPRPIGDAVRDGTDEQIRIARGVDHNYLVMQEESSAELIPAARIEDPETGRTMEVLTTMPGMQVYTGNSLDGSLTGYSGRLYRQTDAICFETQFFPNSPNHPEFPSTELRPGERFESSTIYRFGTME